MLPSAVFRACDIRGLADRDLPNDGVTLLGQALATHFHCPGGPKLVLARDCRLSSPRLHTALLSGLLASGAHVIDLGVVPTPLAYFAAAHLHAHAAIVITGSHNPPDHNGFKITNLHGQAIQDLHLAIQHRHFLSSPGTCTPFDILPAYLDELTLQFPLPRKLKVVVDSGNGTAGPVIEQLLSRLNCQFLSLYGQMDGRFPNHHPDPAIPANLSPLSNAVRATGSHLGIAFDTDADRIGAVDELGNPILADMLLLLYARPILARFPGAAIIGDVKCSQTLFEELARLGACAVMYKTGHALIKEKMKELDAPLAGEMSGHIFFSDRYYGFDDALYAACRLLEIVASSPLPLSQHLSGLPARFSTPELRYPVPDSEKEALVARVAARFRTTHPIIDTDGARVLFPHGWGLIRASNTQPAIVMRLEASTPNDLAKYRELFESALVSESKMGRPQQEEAGH